MLLVLMETPGPVVSRSRQITSARTNCMSSCACKGSPLQHPSMTWIHFLSLQEYWYPQWVRIHKGHCQIWFNKQHRAFARIWRSCQRFFAGNGLSVIDSSQHHPSPQRKGCSSQHHPKQHVTVPSQGLLICVQLAVTPSYHRRSVGGYLSSSAS